jgi:hypothetical protein
MPTVSSSLLGSNRLLSTLYENTITKTKNHKYYTASIFGAEVGSVRKWMVYTELREGSSHWDLHVP